MSWDRKPGTKKRYYYRSRWVNGRCVKEYLGTGPAAAKAARQDETARRQRERGRQQWESLLAKIEAARLPIENLCEQSTILFRAVLVAAGLYLHRGHEWRRRGGLRDGNHGTQEDSPGPKSDRTGRQEGE